MRVECGLRARLWIQRPSRKRWPVFVDTTICALFISYDVAVQVVVATEPLQQGGPLALQINSYCLCRARAHRPVFSFPNNSAFLS